MQALRRKLTKRPAKSNSSDKDRSVAETLGAAEIPTVGPPTGGNHNMTIAGELSATRTTSRRGRRLVRGSKSSSPTPPLNKRESFQLPLSMTHILSIFMMSWLIDNYRYRRGVSKFTFCRSRNCSSHFFTTIGSTTSRLILVFIIFISTSATGKCYEHTNSCHNTSHSSGNNDLL